MGVNAKKIQEKIPVWRDRDLMIYYSPKEIGSRLVREIQTKFACFLFDVFLRVHKNVSDLQILLKPLSFLPRDYAITLHWKQHKNYDVLRILIFKYFHKKR